jgi:hypothetical protein
VDADGNGIDGDNISAHLGSGIIMLAVGPDSYMALNNVFTTHDKDYRRAQVDDLSLPSMRIEIQ